MPLSRLPRLFLLLLCAALLAACARPSGPPVYKGRTEIADLRNFPQDLTSYLGRDREKPILSASEAQAALDRYRRSYFMSWHMAKPSVSRKEASLMLQRRARGWKNGSVRWQDHEWAAMRANADMAAWPNINLPGVVIRATDLREMPTHLPRFDKPAPDPREYPFDYFQYTRLPVGFPVLLCHVSADNRWYYVETSLASGWVDAEDLALAGAPFMAAWESASWAAIVREKTVLGDTGETADIGTVLPRAGQDAVMVPVRMDDGQAGMVRADLAQGSCEAMPLAMTPAAVARLGNAVMGQHYGWGGTLGLRDCSALTRDLMTPFGIWLPRNSQSQAKAGDRVSLGGMTAGQREATVLAQGVPFASLLTLKGHVVLYVGPWKGRPAILHDFWGIRVDEPPGEDNRLILGRVVVTSLTPGQELPTLHNRSTIGDRFHSLTVLGGRP